MIVLCICLDGWAASFKDNFSSGQLLCDRIPFLVSLSSNACGVFRDVSHIDIQRAWGTHLSRLLILFLLYLEDILFIHSIFSNNTFFFNPKEKKRIE